MSFDPVLNRSTLTALFSGLVAKAVLSAASPPLPAPTEIRPEISLVRYANIHQIPLVGFSFDGPAEPRPGDQVTTLFTIIDEKNVRRQWLAVFNVDALTAREARSRPGTGLGILSLFQSSLKTDTGHEFSFEQAPLALEIAIHGPFVENGAVKGEVSVVHARVLATKDYLAHGLVPMAEIELRLRAAGKKNPGISLMFRPKYSDEQMAATKARAVEAGFTEADERVYAEAIYAIVQFGNLSFKTEGLDVITHEMADSPTLFSGAFTNIVWPELQIEQGDAWGLNGTPVYRVPYNFFSKTKAHGSFYFSRARPPLLNLAGFLGLTVDATSKAPGRRLVMRVLAGHRGL